MMRKENLELREVQIEVGLVEVCRDCPIQYAILNSDDRTIPESGKAKWQVRTRDTLSQDWCQQGN